MFLSELFQPNIDEGVHDLASFKAIFMAGPPGAGKNTVIKKLGLNAAGMRLQDVDSTLAYLNKTHPEKADYPSSLKATKKLQTVFQSSGLGLIINTTGRDLRSLVRLNKELKSAGYKTFMVFVDVDYDVALRRIGDREKFATDSRDINRKVDLDYFETAFDDSKYNTAYYEKLFKDNFALVTNNVRINESETGEQLEFRATLQQAARKVERFLQEPISSNLVRQHAEY